MALISHGIIEIEVVTVVSHVGEAEIVLKRLPFFLLVFGHRLCWVDTPCLELCCVELARIHCLPTPCGNGREYPALMWLNFPFYFLLFVPALLGARSAMLDLIGDTDHNRLCRLHRPLSFLALDRSTLGSMLQVLKFSVEAFPSLKETSGSKKPVDIGQWPPEPSGQNSLRVSLLSLTRLALPSD
jgi:hypothetical protein